MAQTKSITIRPRDGGRLASGVSVDSAGISDYTVKTNFRRTLDAERRREGHDYLWPNMSDAEGKTFSTNPGNQPFPGRSTAVTINTTTFDGVTMEGYIGLPTGDAHIFEVGETIRVSLGSDLVDGTYIVKSVRDDQCRNNITVELNGSQFPPGGWYSDWVDDGMGGVDRDASLGETWSEEPVTLIHMASRPNGRKALIVGTKPRLYKYISFDEVGYVEPAGEYIDTGDADFPYWDGNPGVWEVIASGFSFNAQRWEAVSINGWSVFNNGVDLPYSYRVEDIAAYPLYELREQGIASVGTIAEFGGVLFCGNIKEIKSLALEELFVPDNVGYSPRSVASQSGTTVTLSNNCGFIFTNIDVGRVIIFSTGEQAEIVSFTSDISVEVDVSQEVNRVGFKVYCQAAQAGSVLSDGVTVTGTVSTTTLTASAAFFAPSMVGHEIRILNGDSYVIASYISPTQVTVTLPLEITYAPILFSIIEPDVSDRVTASCSMFDGCMVGRYLVWENGSQVRRITAFIHSAEVAVSHVGTIPNGPFYIQDDKSYGRFTDETNMNHISWRVLWSDYEGPTKFYPSIAGSIVAGSRNLKLSVESHAFKRGDSITIAGAGQSGGNLTATVLHTAVNRFVRLDAPAISTVVNGAVQDSLAAGSLVGFEDLQDDSSGVLKMLELESTLVIYKDTSIFLANRSTVINQPYVFRVRKIPKSHSLYFRHTLSLVNGQYHIYAGKDNFYRFDLSTQRPIEDVTLELCKGQFFDYADLISTESVWASANSTTKEINFSTPTQTLCLDYLFNTASVSDAVVTASGSVKRPSEIALTRETEDWFVMGTEAGTIILYGKAHEPVESWGNVDEILYRREVYPFSAVKNSYDSTVRSGMGDFGSSYVHKILRAIQVVLSSRSGTPPVLVMPLGSEIAAANVTQLLASHFSLDNPAVRNRVSVYFRGYLFGDEIKVSGMDNPVEIVGRTYEYNAEKTNGINLTAKVT